MYHLSIPKDLRGHLPRVVGEFGTSKTLLLLGYGGIAVLLYAITNFNNGWLYTVPTLLGPLLSSLFLMGSSIEPLQKSLCTIGRNGGLGYTGEPCGRTACCFTKPKGVKSFVDSW